MFIRCKDVADLLQNPFFFYRRWVSCFQYTYHGLHNFFQIVFIG